MFSIFLLKPKLKFQIWEYQEFKIIITKIENKCYCWQCLFVTMISILPTWELNSPTVKHCFPNKLSKGTTFATFAIFLALQIEKLIVSYALKMKKVLSMWWQWTDMNTPRQKILLQWKSCLKPIGQLVNEWNNHRSDENTNTNTKTHQNKIITMKKAPLANWWRAYNTNTFIKRSQWKKGPGCLAPNGQLVDVWQRSPQPPPLCSNTPPLQTQTSQNL